MGEKNIGMFAGLLCETSFWSTYTTRTIAKEGDEEASFYNHFDEMNVEKEARRTCQNLEGL